MKFTSLLKQHGISAQQLADHLQLHRVALYAWNRNGVPMRHCVEIEAYSEGKITRKDLRPTDWEKFWPEMGKTV